VEPKAELVFLSGKRKGDVVVLGGARTVIGRQVGDLIVPDGEVSSIHAIISHERGGWYVMDLGSTNGVFVDGEVKLEARLKNKVELRVGQTLLQFRQLGSGEDPQDDGGGPAADAKELAVEKDSAVLAAATAIVPADGLDNPEGLQDLAQRADVGPRWGEEESDYEPLHVDTKKFNKADYQQVVEESAPVQVTLEILEGVDRGSVRRFTQETILLGRLNTDLVLRDSDVSRRHAIIEVFDASQVYLRDLSSTNGSFVNEERVTSARLRNGDELRLGRCTLRFAARSLYQR